MWRRRCRALAASAVAALLVASAPAGTDHTLLDGGTFFVELDPDSSYAPWLIVYDHYRFVDADPCGSAQGTVVLIDGTWAGSLHGRERILELELRVDGEPCPLEPGGVCRGRRFELLKTSILGEAVYLTTRSVYHARGIVEDVTLEVIHDDPALTIAYPFLSSHTNNLSRVYWRTLDGSHFLGSTAADDNFRVYLGNAYLVAQYDPLWERGIISFFGYDVYDARISIWDRDCDNKLYREIVDLTPPLVAGTVWTYRTERTIFSAPRKQWPQYVRHFTERFETAAPAEGADPTDGEVTPVEPPP
jgi:hypothetical protein